MSGALWRDRGGGVRLRGARPPAAAAPDRQRIRVCLVGLLDHAPPIESFNPLFQMPFCGVHFSSFASAFTYGAQDYPLTDVPLQEIVDRVAAGRYKAQPSRVFGFDEIRDAHRLMESNEANGKLVVRL